MLRSFGTKCYQCYIMFDYSYQCYVIFGSKLPMLRNFWYNFWNCSDRLVHISLPMLRSFGTKCYQCYIIFDQSYQCYVIFGSKLPMLRNFCYTFWNCADRLVHISCHSLYYLIVITYCPVWNSTNTTMQKRGYKTIIIINFSGSPPGNTSSLATFDEWPFIWRKLMDDGMATMYGEDLTHISTFSWWGKGFKKDPTTHYFHRYWVSPFLLGTRGILAL